LAPLNIPDRQLSVGFDYAPNLVLQANNEQSLQASMMEWGFIPHYMPNRSALFDFRHGSKNPATGKFQPPIVTLNAIGEEVLEKPMFKKAVLEKRCLVYSSGFYEWQHVYPINKRTGQPLKTPNKIPHFIHLKEQPYFFMAGIWSSWTDQQTGEMVNSFAILTTEANALMENIHNSKRRMPVILPESLAVEWTNPLLATERISELARYQFSTEAMTAYPIAKDFTSSNNPQAPAQVGLFG
jgi:putative SOS response-associated peptidase YedK